MQAFLLVGLGGGIGAMGRYGVGVLLGHFWHSRFPLATMSVNVLGSLLMGLLIGLLARTTPAGQNELRLFLAVGMLGGFTTFSSFSLDVMTLIERGMWGQALGYVLISVLAGILALFAALWLMRLGVAK